MPTAKPETLERIVNIIKDELPKHLSPEFRINDVKAGKLGRPGSRGLCPCLRNS